MMRSGEKVAAGGGAGEPGGLPPALGRVRGATGGEPRGWGGSRAGRCGWSQRAEGHPRKE